MNKLKHRQTACPHAPGLLTGDVAAIGKTPKLAEPTPQQKDAAREERARAARIYRRLQRLVDAGLLEPFL